MQRGTLDIYKKYQQSKDKGLLLWVIISVGLHSDDGQIRRLLCKLLSVHHGLRRKVTISVPFSQGKIHTGDGLQGLSE